jgi:5-methylcytosine-specific restriction endonuclease McrA
MFCSVQCRKLNYSTKIKTAGRFDINGCPSSITVRKFLIATHGNNCMVCSQPGKNWNGQPLTLIVDHINGDAKNWKLANIRLVCPNCDSQLPTFKGRNKGKSTRKYTIIQR